MKKHLAYLATLGLFAGLSACGGGGDSPASLSAPSPVSAPPPNSVPLSAATVPAAAAYQAYIQAPGSKNYLVSNACTGTETISRAPIQAATFEGVNGYSTTLTSSSNFSSGNCTGGTSTETWYYDASNALIGVVTASLPEYAVYQRPLVALPAMAKVGDVGPVANVRIYADATKTALLATEIVTFEINADGTSTNTAFMDLTSTRQPSGSGRPVHRWTRLRIDTAGSFSLVEFSLAAGLTYWRPFIYTEIP